MASHSLLFSLALPSIKQNRPGPPGLAAISPEAVANAAVAGVLGKVNGSIDGFNAIMAVQ